MGCTAVLRKKGGLFVECRCNLQAYLPETRTADAEGVIIMYLIVLLIIMAIYFPAELIVNVSVFDGCSLPMS
jgi:hypothetical protein